MTQIDLAALVAWEGRWAKTIYREFALRNKTSFSRDFDGKDALYSVCTAICLSCGLHPSVGFLHGYTRRGGLAFDLADIFKTELTMTPAFDANIKGGKDAMYALAKALRKDNFNVVKRMIKICLHIGGQHNMSWEDL